MDKERCISYTNPFRTPPIHPGPPKCDGEQPRGFEYPSPQELEESMKEVLSRPKLVVVESPYRGNGYANLELNLRYARACLHDCFLRGEAPFASHLLYTQEGVLSDTNPEERKLGINAGLEWAKCASLSAIYIDITHNWKNSGIVQGVKRAQEAGRAIEFRNLPDDVLNSLDKRILKTRRSKETLIAELKEMLPTLVLT